MTSLGEKRSGWIGEELDTLDWREVQREKESLRLLGAEILRR